MADVFISYKTEDRRRLEPLVNALQADGYSVWWDQHIGTGDDWRQTIERELESARCVIVAWSKRSIGPEGRFVRDEATRAQQRKIYVPVLLDPVQVPLGFGESQAASLRGWRGGREDKRYLAVLAAVQRVVGAQPKREVSRRPSISLSRRALLAGATVAVGAAGLGTWFWFRTPAAAGTDSIAVLPFEDLSGDPERAYFARGMASEIRNSLTRFSGLRVAGSISSEAVKKDDILIAAEKLKVGNILTGNVQQTSSTIRVSAELIDGRSGTAKWAASYDRAPGDAIKIQTEIAKNVAEALAVALSGSLTDGVGIGETEVVAAQQLVFQARDISYEFTPPAFQRSLKLLDQAIALDPNYARAYAIKSFVANNLASAAATPTELAAGRREALQYADKALAIAPKLPIARSALAFAHQLNLKLNEALREHSVALSLAGGDPDVIRNYGMSRSDILGTKSDALRYVDEALSLDPLNPFSHYAHVDVLFDLRRYADAVSYTIQLKRDSPELFSFPFLLGRAFLMLGRVDDARAAFAGVDQENAKLESAGLLAAKVGDRETAAASAAALLRQYGEMASVEIARIYAQAGEKDRAFAALERAWEIRLYGLARLNSDPAFDQLRKDPRYRRLASELGFPA